MFNLEKVFSLNHQETEKAATNKGRMLKIHIDSGNDHVHVQLPIAFVKAVLKMSPQWFARKVSHDAVDLEELVEAIETNFVGEFINIQDAEGESVRISIE